MDFGVHAVVSPSLRPAPRPDQPLRLPPLPPPPLFSLDLEQPTMETSAATSLAETSLQAAGPAPSPAASLGTLGVLKRIASLPSRFIERVRLIDELLEQSAERQAAELVASLNETDLAHVRRLRQAGRFYTDTPMPGPWGFFTSWYMVGLIVVVRSLSLSFYHTGTYSKTQAFLAHRIRNLVVPPRHQQRRREHGHRETGSPTGRLLQRFFPVNLSSTRHRVIMRIPTTALLLRSLLLWVVVTLQVSKLWPTWSILRPLGEKAASLPMEDLCWSTFVATCAAVLVAGINRGLDGSSTSNTAPFNLVSTPVSNLSTL